MSSSGESVYDRFAEPIRRLIKDYECSGKLDRSPLKLKLESESVPDEYLAYPGKVLADPDNNRLFISDQNHNRIVISGIEAILTY